MKGGLDYYGQQFDGLGDAVTGGVIRLSSTVPAVVDFNTCAKPEYPHADVQAAHEGTVKLAFLVDEKGKVKDSKVMTSSGFATLDEAARSALAQCSFQPARKNGKSVQQWTTVLYVWTLR